MKMCKRMIFLRKADFVLLAAAAVIFAIWLACFKPGGSVSVYVDGEIYKTLSLDKDSRIVVSTKFGTNSVVIKNGTVHIEDADCKGKLCERSSISKAGQSIVCLPNRLSVVINGRDKEETDVVV